MLRLRGGGGYEVSFIDVRTGKAHKTYLSDINQTAFQLVATIAKFENLTSSDITFVVDGKPFKKLLKTFALSGQKLTEFHYVKKFNYKDVVFT